MLFLAFFRYMITDIFSFWDYPSDLGGMVIILGRFFFIFVLRSVGYWYSPTSFLSIIFKVREKLRETVFHRGVRRIIGANRMVVRLLFFTFIYVFGIFSPWCYPLGVHTVIITGISLAMWLTGVMRNILGENIIYMSHFCLSRERLGLRGVISDIELVRKFLQWITVRLRLRLNIIVGTFIITGVFRFVGFREVLVCYRIFRGISVLVVLKIIILWAFGLFAFLYELGIITLQVFLYIFLWVFYLKDRAVYCSLNKSY